MSASKAPVFAMTGAFSGADTMKVETPSSRPSRLVAYLYAGNFAESISERDKR